MQRRYEYQMNNGTEYPKAKTGPPGKDLRLMFIISSDSPCPIYSRFCKWREEGTLLKVFEHLKKMPAIKT